MPVLPKSLLVLGASLQTARTARRLRQVNAGVPAQHRIFRELVGSLAATELGKAVGIEPSIDYAKFRQRVPVRSYEQLAPYIDRMKRGEADVLWPGTCALYALSSGTTTGEPKWLPVTELMLVHLRRAGMASLLYYCGRVGHSRVFRGRHLLLGRSTALVPVPEAKPFVAFGGTLAAISALNFPPWAERHLYEPGAEIARIADWSRKIDAIVERTRHLDITLLAGMPAWLLALIAALRGGTTGQPAAPSLQAIWPNLECIVHGGAPLAPFHDELRRAVGTTVAFHEVYSAAEGFIAAQDADASAGLRLLAEHGVFFEFLPLAEYDEAHPAGLGARAVPLEDVRAGQDYVLLMTTPGGLCRYVPGDVVRFVSTTPARLIYLGRTKLLLTAFGERVLEKDLTDALVAVCGRHGWTIVNFHVAPVFVSSLTGQKRGHHEWWVELRPGTVETPTGPLLAAELDRELMTRNCAYGSKRKAGGMDAPEVRLVMPGLFEHWIRHHGKRDGQHKLPRSRADRQIADELAALACFNND